MISVADRVILRGVIAGLLLVVGGGLLAVGSRQDWLTLDLAQGGTVTLSVNGTFLGGVLLALAGLIVAIGLFRIERGYSEDETLHRIAAYCSIAVAAIVVARAWIFLDEHNLRVSDSATYGHLSFLTGLYLLAGGAVVTLLAKYL